jgi:lipopolysaccharide cholinephosphotransferase
MKEDFLAIFPDQRLENSKLTELRQAQLIILRILKIVDYICRKHNIGYWLHGGTLLGAVRHGGFIPWDDDLDIAMTRQDYNKFLSVAKDELPEDLFMQNLETTKLASNTWTQIKDRKSLIVIREGAAFHQGLYIDIFPMDSYSRNFLKRNFHERLLKTLYIYVYAINAPLKKPFLSKKYLAKNIIKITLKTVFFGCALFNKHVIYNLNLKYRKNIIKTMEKNPKDNYGFAADTLNWRNIYKAEHIFPLKKIKFEDYEFLAPNNCEAYLTNSYGKNFMTPPPQHKRVQHYLKLKPILTEEEQRELNKGFI